VSYGVVNMCRAVDMWVFDFLWLVIFDYIACSFKRRFIIFVFLCEWHGYFKRL